MVPSLLSLDSASGIPILWCCFFQTIAIGWIFGVRRFAACVEQMTGYKPSLYWIATWGYIAPIVMAVRGPCQTTYFDGICIFVSSISQN